MFPPFDQAVAAWAGGANAIAIEIARTAAVV
jgi:hypothetical protein